MKRGWKIALGLLAVPVAAAVFVFFATRAGYQIHEDIRTDIEPAPVPDLLADDKLEDKRPGFDAALIDTRPFGQAGNQWQINASAAVIRLDVPDIRSDEHEALQRLYPDYVSAAKALEAAGFDVLPSVNLLGGKAKQFDDGLYAAMDQYMAQNDEEGVRSVELCVRQIMTELNPRGEAYAWLFAALEVGQFVAPEEHQRRPPQVDELVTRFMADAKQSTPVGFYTWNEHLKRTFQFLRYLQQPFHERAGTPDVLARALRKYPQAREQYERMLAFYTKLTNPFKGLSLLSLDEADTPLTQVAKAHGARDAVVSFLPYSDSEETALFERLYPNGVPDSANLMEDLIRAIRDGKLDLAPDSNSGWYDYQLHALETLLLPEKGPENQKLLLTKKYKLRLVDAFKAMVTKTRETHIRQMGEAVGSAAPMPEGALRPRLRVEPNPTYYLRIARSYGFLQNFLSAAVEDLNHTPGWREQGHRGIPLGDELQNMRLLFYGLYFVSCEDIGLKPQLLADEDVDADYTRALATTWLKDWQTDPDLAVDTRVAVPVYRMPGEYTRFWCTVGVRPIKLAAAYVRPPSWHPVSGGEWEEVPGHKLEAGNWVILGDDFVEAQLAGEATLTREDLRIACDAYPSKEAIAEALQR
jgi:hypothetical protein